MTLGANATDVLTGALVPTALLVRDEEWWHQALGRTRRYTHAALAVPVTGALTTVSTTGIVTTFLAKAIGGAVDLFYANEAEQL